MTVPRQPQDAPGVGPRLPAAPRRLLETEVLRSAVAGRLAVGRIVKLHERRIVAEGAFGGRPCFIKLYVGSDSAAQARRAEAAIAEARRHMAGGSFRVAQSLFTARRRGFLVLEPAPGMSLETEIVGADPAERARLIRLAGSWLEAYCAPRREERRFSCERFGAFHLPRMETPGWKGQLRDTPLIRALAEHLAGLALDADGAPISVAVTHGDFVARNLHHHAGTLCGFDVETTRALPIAWDLALFLVEITGREGADASWYGVRAADVEALVASGVIGDEEAARVLPLYIGHHLLRRCIRMGPGPHLDKVTEAAARFIAG